MWWWTPTTPTTSTSTPLNLTTTTWTSCSTSPPLVATAMVLCFLWCPGLSCSFWNVSQQCYLCWLCLFVCALTGVTVQETDKTDNFELNTSPNVSNAEPATDAGQKRVKVAPKAVRFKRRDSGKGKSAHGAGGPGGGCFIMRLKKVETTKWCLSVSRPIHNHHV